MDFADLREYQAETTSVILTGTSARMDTPYVYMEDREVIAWFLLT